MMNVLCIIIFNILYGTAMATPVTKEPHLIEDLINLHVRPWGDGNVDGTVQITPEEIGSMITKVRRLESTIEMQDKMIENLKQNHSSTTSPPQASNPKDCADVFANGDTNSGVHPIYPFRNQNSVNVFCDMEADDGKWTVILSRNALTYYIDFNLTWNYYQEFFGDAENEYWIGNENLHALTSNLKYEVKWEARDENEHYVWAKYDSFSVASKDYHYMLTLGEYNNTSTGQDIFGFRDNDKQQFSTYDYDHDNSDGNCAQTHDGGWWYNNCTWMNPTGRHLTEWDKWILRSNGQNSTEKHLETNVEEGLWITGWSKIETHRRYPTSFQMKIRFKE